MRNCAEYWQVSYICYPAPNNGMHPTANSADFMREAML